MKMTDWADNLGYHRQSSKRLLIYGPPGSGKTQLMGTFPDPFIIDTDRGLKTLEKEGLLPPPHRILELDRESECFQIVCDILIRLRDGMEPFKENPPKTVCIDSVSKLGDFLLYQFMQNPSRAKDAKLGPRDYNYQKATFAHWGVLLNQMTTIFDIAKDLTINVVATAGVRTEEDAEGSPVESNPYLLGRFREIIGHCFDEFLYMEVTGAGKNLHYEAHSVPYRYHKGKTRTLNTHRIEDPTFEKIYGKEVKTK